MKKIISEIIGWYGTIAIILAYALLSFSIINSDSIIYQILNFSGALGIILISLLKKAYQPATLNIIWAVIAVFAIVRIIIG